MTDTVKYEFESAAQAHDAVADAVDMRSRLRVENQGGGAVVLVPAADEPRLAVTMIRHGGHKETTDH